MVQGSEGTDSQLELFNLGPELWEIGSLVLDLVSELFQARPNGSRCPPALLDTLHDPTKCAHSTVEPSIII